MTELHGFPRSQLDQHSLYNTVVCLAGLIPLLSTVVCFAGPILLLSTVVCFAGPISLYSTGNFSPCGRRTY